MAVKPITTIQIQGQITWQAHQDPATGRWLGVCAPLNLNAVGDTYAELQAFANEAMALLFLDLFESRDLDAFLRRNGWKMIGEPQPGVAPRFDVPADWRSGSRYEELVHARR